MKKAITVKLGVLCVLSVFIMACASETLKAPCNEYATFCGTKTKINHW